MDRWQLKSRPVWWQRVLSWSATSLLASTPTSSGALSPIRRSKKRTSTSCSRLLRGLAMTSKWKKQELKSKKSCITISRFTISIATIHLDQIKVISVKTCQSAVSTTWNWIWQWSPKYTTGFSSHKRQQRK